MPTNHRKFQFRPYRRSFKQPLHTHHGLWSVRQGIILQFTDAQGRIGWGEIAPVAAFGTESSEQALAFCQSLPPEITAETIAQIPPTLPACQFGLESAWEWLESGCDRDTLRDPSPPLTCSHLLPTGAAALTAWQFPYQQGSRTFKWKIGVAAIEAELQQFEQLVQSLPTGTRLRLDANGGLTPDAACQWLRRCDALCSPAEVEFLEQPLPPDQFELLLSLSRQFQTPIALDESVATFSQLEACYQQGWRGIFVIKAAIAGSPSRLRQFCQAHPLDIVWSSVFETSIAQHFITHYLIPTVPTSQRAVGFGVNQWFTESHLDQSTFQQLWCSF